MHTHIYFLPGYPAGIHTRHCGYYTRNCGQKEQPAQMSCHRAKKHVSSMSFVSEFSLSQPGCEVGQTLDRSHIADSDGHGTGLTNHYDELLASGHSRIEQIAGEHRIVL